MKRKWDYYLLLIICSTICINYLQSHVLNAKSFLVIASINIIFNFIYYSIKNIKDRKDRKDRKDERKKR